MNAINKIGMTSGQLTVIRRIKSKNRNAMWLCQCSCGKYTEVAGHNLMGQHPVGERRYIVSCGCRRATHGLTGTPEYRLWHAAKQRSKIYHKEFNIRPIDIRIPSKCPVLGIKLTNSHKRWGDSGPSLDRIDNTKGYIQGNIAVISLRANVLKKNATAKELRLVADYIDKHNNAVHERRVQ